MRLQTEIDEVGVVLSVPGVFLSVTGVFLPVPGVFLPVTGVLPVAGGHADTD